MIIATGFRENKIALKDLNLWSENPRFPQIYFGKTESELIDYIVSVTHYKIKAFGKEIVEDFDMPIFEKLAIYDGEGENVAYEGNRRLAVYKLLLNPDITSNEEIKDYFRQLKRSINIDSDFRIDCVISNDKKEILRYVNRKHLNNNNEVAWGAIENSNAKLRWLDNPEKLDIFQSNLSIIIRNMEIPISDKDKVLGKGYVTTLFRILNSSTAARYFNFIFDDDNNLVPGDENFLQKLEVIICDIIQNKTYKGKLFSRLNVNEIGEYLNSIKVFKDKEKVKIPEIQKAPNKIIKDKSEDRPLADSFKKDNLSKVPEISSTPINNIKGTSAAIVKEKPTKLKPKSTLRRHLIPKDFKLIIKEDKINNIYRELRDDLIIDDSLKSVPNAVGVLFRVFLEVSLDHYAEKKQGHIFKTNDSISVKISWVKTKLIEKGYSSKLFKNIDLVGSSSVAHSYLSIEKFHQYVHSSTVEPSSSELKSKWNLLQPFFNELWCEINKKI